jgi:hypothetical protein
MNRTRILTWRLAASLIAAFVLVLGASIAGSEDTQTIAGEVEPAEHDEDGDVSSVGIYDNDWGWVVISNTGKGKELLDYVGAMVTVTGTIEKIDDGRGPAHVMEVSSYSIDEPAEHEEYPEDWDPDE